MAMQFGSTSQMTNDFGVKILTYGDAGIGKTMLCATLPNPIIISAESGLLSLSRGNIEKVFGVNQPNICYDVRFISIETIEDVDAAYNWLISNPDQYSSVGLDSITEIAEKCLSNAKKSVKDPRQAYGDLIDRMTILVRKFRDIPNKHVYFSAKMEKFKDSIDGMTRFGPAMPGSKLGDQLPYFFDEVFRLQVGKDQTTQTSFRWLQTGIDMQSTAKDRSGALEFMEYPHLGNVINKIVAHAAGSNPQQ